MISRYPTNEAAVASELPSNPGWAKDAIVEDPRKKTRDALFGRIDGSSDRFRGNAVDPDDFFNHS